MAHTKAIGSTQLGRDSRPKYRGVKIHDGYARNFLLPRKLGRPASAGAVNDAAVRSARAQDAASTEREQARALAAKLGGSTIVMHGRANEKGTLFSGIPRATVAAEVSKAAGIHIPPDHITSEDHLKHLGPHAIHVRFAEGVAADLTVDIRQSP